MIISLCGIIESKNAFNFTHNSLNLSIIEIDHILKQFLYKVTFIFDFKFIKKI